MTIRTIAILFALSATVAVAQQPKPAEPSKAAEKPAFVLTSDAFTDNAMIPKVYTCDSTNMSPELQWTGAPEGTKSLALVVEDPDAPHGTWIHWVAFNIDPGVDELAAGVAGIPRPDSTMWQGVSSFKEYGYGGPCPPTGVHRYYFKLFALDAMLGLKGDIDEAQLLEAIQGHVLAETQLMGRYTREKGK